MSNFRQNQDARTLKEQVNVAGRLVVELLGNLSPEEQQDPAIMSKIVQRLKKENLPIEAITAGINLGAGYTQAITSQSSANTKLEKDKMIVQQGKDQVAVQGALGDLQQNSQYGVPGGIPGPQNDPQAITSSLTNVQQYGLNAAQTANRAATNEAAEKSALNASMVFKNYQTGSKKALSEGELDKQYARAQEAVRTTMGWTKGLDGSTRGTVLKSDWPKIQTLLKKEGVEYLKVDGQPIDINGMWPGGKRESLNIALMPRPATGTGSTGTGTSATQTTNTGAVKVAPKDVGSIIDSLETNTVSPKANYTLKANHAVNTTPTKTIPTQVAPSTQARSYGTTDPRVGAVPTLPNVSGIPEAVKRHFQKPGILERFTPGLELDNNSSSTLAPRDAGASTLTNLQGQQSVFGEAEGTGTVEKLNEGKIIRPNQQLNVKGKALANFKHHGITDAQLNVSLDSKDIDFNNPKVKNITSAALWDVKKGIATTADLQQLLVKISKNKKLTAKERKWYSRLQDITKYTK